jgi:hypothetical protein
MPLLKWAWGWGRQTSGPFKPDSGLSGDVSIFSGSVILTGSGCFDLLNPVIPTGTDHRKAMICGAEGPAVADVTQLRGAAEIESE